MTAALLLAEPEVDTGSYLERHLTDDGFAVVRTEDAIRPRELRTSISDAMAPSPGGPTNAQGESNRLPVERWRIIQKYFGGDK